MLRISVNNVFAPQDETSAGLDLLLFTDV